MRPGNGPLQTWIFLLAASALCASGARGAPNATASFLGPQAEWGGVMLVVQHESPLFGAREYYLSGTGTIDVVDVRPQVGAGPQQAYYSFGGRSAEVAAVIQRLASADVLEAAGPAFEGPPPTCNEVPTLTMRNGQGAVVSVPFPRARPSAAYEEAWLEVASLQRLLDAAVPISAGPYSRSFVPSGFAWSAAIVTDRRPDGFAPIATTQERLQAEQEFQARVQEQLEAISRVEAEQDAAGP